MGPLAVARIREVAEANDVDVEIRSEEVPPELPQPAEYLGSPTILVNGLDIDPAARDLPGSGLA